jgi:hypothetical protein
METKAMRLVYTATQQPVKVGDVVTRSDGPWKVQFFRPPHKSSSSGKIVLIADGETIGCEFFVGVIGAEWIEREDRR